MMSLLFHASICEQEVSIGIQRAPGAFMAGLDFVRGIEDGEDDVARLDSRKCLPFGEYDVTTL